MALNKQIELENGIILNYHRIVSINKITNNCNIIEVASYTSENQREKEKEYQEVQKKNTEEEVLTNDEQEMLNTGINVLVEVIYINKEYDEKETIEEAYKYLKTLDRFKDAEDV